MQQTQSQNHKVLALLLRYYYDDDYCNVHVTRGPWKETALGNNFFDGDRTVTVHPAYKAIPVIWPIVWWSQVRPCIPVMLGYIWPIFIDQIVSLISGKHCTF